MEARKRARKTGHMLCEVEKTKIMPRDLRAISQFARMHAHGGVGTDHRTQNTEHLTMEHAVGSGVSVRPWLIECEVHRHRGGAAVLVIGGMQGETLVPR